MELGTAALIGSVDDNPSASLSNTPAVLLFNFLLQQTSSLLTTRNNLVGLTQSIRYYMCVEQSSHLVY
jgi:hypothetical protein